MKSKVTVDNETKKRRNASDGPLQKEDKKKTQRLNFACISCSFLNLAILYSFLSLYASFTNSLLFACCEETVKTKHEKEKVHLGTLLCKHLGMCDIR